MRITVNGEQRDVATAAHSALEVIRSDLGLTGAKSACSTGSCGACVILVDGVPVAGCLLSAAELEGRTVTTVEGVSTPSLHPVQRALVSTDGVQCGFCTPGIVMTAVAFCDRWRSERPGETPEKAEVVAALSGHLCRCGAYPGIVEAVRGACAGVYDDGGPPVPRVDAVEKVTGAAAFTADIPLTGALEGRVLRSTEPNAAVLSVDAAQALTLPGVRAFVELLPNDRRVRYVGAPIGAVAAESIEAADRALDVIEVTYGSMAAAVGWAARDPSAPVVHERGWSPPSNNEARPVPLPRRGNRRGPSFALSKRRFTARRLIASARRRADPLLVEDTWMVGGQSHGAAEPHSAVAVWTGGSLTVYASTQSVSTLRRRLAKRYGLDEASVTVVSHHVGGAFGSKQGILEEVLFAVALAKETGQPVRVIFDRVEEQSVTGYRPGVRIDLALLAAVDGALEAISVEADADVGASAGQTIAGLVRLAYPGPPMSLMDYEIVSNASPAKPFQAPGFPQALFALETAVDEMAWRLGEDPVRLRRQWSRRPLRHRLYDWVDGRPLWNERPVKGGQSGPLRTGVGVAFGTWYFGYDPATEVTVSVESSGLVVATNCQDLGTGTRTVLATAAAEVFGLALEDVDVRLDDPAAGWGPTSSASRVTPSLYPTARLAAENLRGRLISEVREHLGMAGAEPAEGGVTHAGETVPWLDLFPRLTGRSFRAARPADGRRPVIPLAVEGVQVGSGLSDSVCIAEVELEAATGRVRLTRVEAGLAAGRIVAPVLARSQVHGAVARGMGGALYEERILDPVSGLCVTADLDSYRMPAIGDMPEVAVEFIEEGFEHAQAVGIAELAITAVPAAIANAVASAAGRHPRVLPLTPDRVLELLR